MKLSPLFATLLILCSCSFTGCQSKPQTPFEPLPVPITATTPSVKDLVIHVESIGTLQPLVCVDLFAQSRGVLNRVLIQEGEWVEEQQPLFIIDSRPYAIKVEEAKAQLNSDRAGLSSLQKKLDRYQSLVKKELVSASEWDELQAQIAKAQSSIEMDQARIESALLDLEQCTVRSPISGRAGKIDASVGQLITPGQSAPLVAIAKLDPLRVEFTLTEKEFAKINPSNRALEIIPLSRTGEVNSPVGDSPVSDSPVSNSPVSQSQPLVTDATLTFLDNAFDSKTGLLIARGIVDNKEHTLRPGQSVRVKLAVSIQQQALLIPQKAVRYNQEGPYVYIIPSDKKVQMRQLQLGDEREKDVIVLSGLEAGDQIVLDGHLRLMNGTQVEISQ